MAWTTRFGRTRKSGFTLIEILIALVVLFIGIVGIIALFPIGIESTKQSVQDTNAALIAESIHHAIIIAMRNPVGGYAWIVHDGVPLHVGAPASPEYGPTTTAYPLALSAPALVPYPTLVTTAGALSDHHPSAPPGAGGGYPTVGLMPDIFQLGRAPMNAAGVDPINAVIMDIRGADTYNATPNPGFGTDVTLDYHQYFWDFWVQQVADSSNIPLPLYQFRIRIWRNYEGAKPKWATPWNDASWAPQGTPNQLLQEFRVLVASNS